ncbi:MAG TPA: glycosyltransferase family 2 protein, partial [Candidatus Methanofastidiosa archaeon]|nr:glycosyltransferase family 2 protein [Candidatus Methanofastidiosa archaeon]
MSPLLRTILIWGVWLLIPLLMDGIGSVLRVVSVLFYKSETNPEKYKDEDLPKVSLIVPAYNEEKIIGRTLSSLQLQDYPQDKIEILVIDDGSLDATSDVVLRYINKEGTKRMKINGNFYSIDEYEGTINLFTSGVNKGKANALNLGIKHAHGDILFTIDSDTVLDRSAIRNMVTYLMDNEDIGAACGVIEVNWHMLEERDKEGELVLDEEGDIKEKKLSFTESFVAKSQFLEYVNAFRL